MANYQSAVEQIKSRVNIVDVINPLLPLKRAGSNYKACCPFHKEKTPSFVVNEARGNYHCFGCGEHGDAIKFIEKYYSLSFTEAVERLAGQYGIEIEQGNYVSNKSYDAYYEANRLAARFYFNKLRADANQGFGYLKQRGMDPKTMNDFGIGWAPDSWSELRDALLKQGIEEKTLVELGLLSVSRNEKSKGNTYDKFRSRVVFPIINTKDKVIGFGGRIVGDGSPKYLNSDESAIFVKKNNLYGLNKTRSHIQQEGFAILVEGYMDCVSLYQYGIKNVVASLGTALTDGQARLLSRYTKKVVLCYDADAAGINAAQRGISVLRAANMEVLVLHVDDGKDPDEYVKKHGRDAFLELIERRAMPDVDYRVDILRRSYDLSDTTQGIKFLRGVAGILKTLSPVETDIYIQKFSQLYHISAGALRRETEGSKEQRAAAPARTEASEPARRIITDASDLKLERMIIKLIMLHSDYYEGFAKYPEAFVSNEGYLIKELFDKKYKKGIDFDFDELKNSLEDKEYEYLSGIIAAVATGDDELAFRDCIDKLEDKRRSRRLKEIEETLQMADSLPEENVNQEQMNALMSEYQSLQSKNRGMK